MMLLDMVAKGQQINNSSIFIQFYYQKVSQVMSQKATKERPQQYTRKKIQCYSYGLSDQIGKGYSSKVYKGRNDDTNQPVAVKVIDLKQLKNQINRTLLDSEIDILKELRNLPYILSLHDVFTTKNNTYLVTELCHSDLSKSIKKHLKETEVIPLMQQIIKGYLEFQQKGIVHRDLKPANILMMEDGTAKIADFGFGIRTQQLGKSNRYNVGSPLYMAPQSLRKNQYSFKSDIWALGIIFYEMLLNDTPWRAKSEKELLRKIQTQPIQSIIASKNITAIGKEFLVKTLKIDKNRRMNPEELALFSFDPDHGANILAEKNLNTTMKQSFKYQNFMMSSPSCNVKTRNDKSADKQPSIPSKSKSINKNLVPNQSVNFFQLDPTHNHSVQSPSTFGKEQKTARVATIKSETNLKQNRKLISKILITQVHFCRFLFKLMQKLKQSSKIGLLSQLSPQIYDNLIKNYSGIIRHKIDKLNNFDEQNYINCQHYNQYKSTSDFDKLMKISHQYNDRYKVELQKNWNQEYDLTSEPTNLMIKHLFELLKSVVSTMAAPEEQISMLSKDIVILDYLITSHQLIEMVRANPNGYERFARKSRIEEIVEGKTVEIHLDLYNQIMDRVKQIMLKKHFVSFGGQTVEGNHLIVV